MEKTEDDVVKELGEAEESNLLKSLKSDFYNDFHSFKKALLSSLKDVEVQKALMISVLRAMSVFAGWFFLFIIGGLIVKSLPVIDIMGIIEWLF